MKLGHASDAAMVQLQEEDLDCPLNLTNQDPNLKVASANAYFGLFIAVLSWTYYVVFLILYILRRRHSRYLERRLLPFVILTTIGFSYESSWGIREFTGRNNFPCVVSEGGIYLTFWFVAAPVIIRVYLFYRRIVAYKLYGTANFLNNLKERYMRTGHHNLILETFEQRDSSPRLKGIKGSLATILNRTADSTSQIRDSNNSRFDSFRLVQGGAAAQLKSGVCQRRMNIQLKVYQFLASAKAGYLMFFLLSVVFSYLYYLHVEEFYSCTGCEGPESRQQKFLVAAIFFLFLVVVCIYSFVRIWNEPDPLHMKEELGQMLLLAVGGVVAYLVLEVLFQDIYLDGKIYWGYVLMMTYMVVFFIMVPLQIHRSYLFDKDNGGQRYDMLKFLPYFRNDKPVPADNGLLIGDVMKSESMSNQFKSVCAYEQCLECYYLWVEVSQFQERYEKYSPGDKRTAFCFLYDMFIANDGTLPVNISSEHRDELKRVFLTVIDADADHEVENALIEEVVSKDVFNVVKAEMESLLNFGPLMRYKSSKAYQDTLI